ncbi:SDR family NAD(P)-dependent oxidoreductase [Pseudophaeobacter arcticus]|uniref:SDR family NAD(P)-dependent oxidoreductase n=1 Tax=Pseudophaeobacter arcticus TaxID=385492 RepID=UPI0039E3560B
MVKPVLITGGAHGIGRAVAALFQQENNVALTWCHRAPDTALNDNQLFLQADLTQDGSAEQVVKATMARFGRMDAIVNNAGEVLTVSGGYRL